MHAVNTVARVEIISIDFEYSLCSAISRPCFNLGLFIHQQKTAGSKEVS